jgi:LysR family transcriptional regulator for bpeEF and oprC
MNRLDAMELFTRVVETGSFTAAAASLRIPRASATTRLQALEARLGVKLLHRTTRRVSLTTEGALYFEECSRLLKELGELEAELSEASARPRGRLRVDVPAAAGRHVLAPGLPAFCARYPEIVVELGSTDRAVDLLAEGVDCVVRGGSVHDERLAARKLAALPVVTCAAPGYLARAGTPKHPRELEGHRFVNFFSPRTGRVFEVDFERGGEVHSFVPPHAVAANDADTWLALAAAGLGLVQAPLGPQLRQLLGEGRLRRVLADWTVPALPMHVLYPQSRRLPARVRVFIDWVVEVYAAEAAAAERFFARKAPPKRRR